MLYPITSGGRVGHVLFPNVGDVDNALRSILVARTFAVLECQPTDLAHQRQHESQPKQSPQAAICSRSDARGAHRGVSTVDEALRRGGIRADIGRPDRRQMWGMW